jgi:hypothetical protein
MRGLHRAPPAEGDALAYPDMGTQTPGQLGSIWPPGALDGSRHHKPRLCAMHRELQHSTARPNSTPDGVERGKLGRTNTVNPDGQPMNAAEDFAPPGGCDGLFSQLSRRAVASWSKDLPSRQGQGPSSTDCQTGHCLHRAPISRCARPARAMVRRGGHRGDSSHVAALLQRQHRDIQYLARSSRCRLSTAPTPVKQLTMVSTFI